jgi:DNA-binding TFAR19-related protein (PDSD5 family)
MDQQQRLRQEQEAQQAEARLQLLSQVLSLESKERLNRIRLVKPEKVRQIEDIIIATVRQNNLTSIPDSQLIQLLEQVSQSEQKAGKVQITRRGKLNDDKWDDDDEGW